MTLLLSIIGWVGIHETGKEKEGIWVQGVTHAKAEKLASAHGVWRDTGSSLWPKHVLFEKETSEGARLCRALNASQVKTWLVSMWMSSPTRPLQKHEKDQTRPCLNVQNKCFYFSACSLWLKSLSTAWLEPKNIYKTIEKQNNIYIEHRLVGSCCDSSLCKAASSKCISVTFPKALSGLLGALEAVTPLQVENALFFPCPALGRPGHVGSVGD